MENNNEQNFFVGDVVVIITPNNNNNPERFINIVKTPNTWIEIEINENNNILNPVHVIKLGYIIDENNIQ